MKYLFFTFIFSFNALTLELTPREKKLLKKRIEIFGLSSTNKEPIELKEKTEYDQEIIYSLNKHIKSYYVKKAESYLGKCLQSECIKEKEGFLTLKTKEKDICLPYTKCEFYKCMEEKYQCKPGGVNYFTDLAYPTCKNYLKNITKKYFSQKGYDWIYSVMVCLQKGLITECELEGNCKKESVKKTCDYITDFTLRFHPGCYIKSGIGVCNLPFKDQINIWRTVAKYLTKDELKQAIATVKHCIIKERT